MRAVRENEVLNPSDMIGFGDAMWRYQHYDVTLPWGSALLSPFNDTDPRMAVIVNRPTEARHGGRWNIGFCDGHVENLRSTNLFDNNASDVLKRWNRDDRPLPPL